MQLLECLKCGTEKSIDDFHRSKNHVRGYNSYCKECIKEKNRVYHSYNVRLRKEQNLRNLYGMTMEQFQQLLIDQDYKCALCDKFFVQESETMHACVDHDHDTRKIRGILCKGCNFALGHYEKLSKNPRLQSYLNITES